MEFPFNYDDLPLKGAVDAYIQFKRPVGDFLQAVINNDLLGAVSRADNRNLPMLPVYITYLYNEAPQGCWGKPDSYKKWMEGKQ